MEMQELKKAIEAIIFYARKPVSIRKLSANLTEVNIDNIRQAVIEIQKDFSEHHGFSLNQIAGGYLFLTNEKYAEWIKKVEGKPSAVKLSSAALETMAIIAFKQPVTRAEIEAIRGVGCSQVINGLIEKKLVTIKGRKNDELGSPLLYGTTNEFLQHFGLNSIKDLPSPDEL